MSDVNQAIVLTLQHEGGFVDNPDDRGGATNMGITQEDLPGSDIRELTISQAISFYKEHFVKPWMSEIHSQAVANKVFDMSVLLGISTAVRLLQRALGFSSPRQDGVFGDETLASVNDAGDNLLPAYKRVLAAHFRWIGETEPSQQQFVDGWVARANS